MSENKIILIKLTTGEEVIGKLITAAEGALVINKPRVMMLQPMPGTNQVGIQMIPFLVGIPDGEATIYTDKIVGEATNTLPKELEDGYLQQTTNIKLAGANGIDLK